MRTDWSYEVKEYSHSKAFIGGGVSDILYLEDVEDLVSDIIENASENIRELEEKVN